MINQIIFLKPTQVNWLKQHTLFPRSWAIARAIAVFPVPGGPAIRTARPDIFLVFIISTIIPAAYKVNKMYRKNEMILYLNSLLI